MEGSFNFISLLKINNKNKMGKLTKEELLYLQTIIRRDILKNSEEEPEFYTEVVKKLLIKIK